MAASPVPGRSTLRARAGARPVVPILCVLAAVAVGSAAWAILGGAFGRAGWAALAGGVLLIAAGAVVRETDRPREWVVLSLVDRAFDGAILGSLAWTLRASDPAASAGALVALAAGYLAAYVRARGGSLGYGVEASVVVPALRSIVIGLALLGGWVGTGAWVVAGLLLLTATVRASQVAKEERA